MNSETTMMAEQCRLHEWATQIRDCQSRPDGMSIASWCDSHGITKANYYYRLRRVRKACLENMPQEARQQIVPVDPGILREAKKDGSDAGLCLDISVRGCSIHVTESTPMPLLEKVLKVVQNA